MWDWADSNDMYFQAAQGWLELGDAASAAQELEQITGLRRAQPDVLKLRLQVCLKLQDWRTAFALAEGLSRVLPSDAEVYVSRSEAARHMPGGGVEYALALLLEVTNQFPHEPAIPFRLACYNCLLKNESTARSWLRIALDVAQRTGTEKQWKSAALQDPDLKLLLEKRVPETAEQL